MDIKSSKKTPLLQADHLSMFHIDNGEIGDTVFKATARVYEEESILKKWRCCFFFGKARVREKNVIQMTGPLDMKML